MYPFRICFTLVIILLALPGPVLPAKIVQSSGQGVILNRDVAAARNRAFDKALTAALKESIASVFQFSEMSNYNEVVERFLNEDPLNYVERYRVLSDRREGNLYKVELEVWVSDEKIRSRLSGASVRPNESGARVFNIGILIGTRLDEQSPSDLFQDEQESYTDFAAKQCRSQGFQITDGAISVDDSPRSFEKLRLNNQLTAMQGRRLGADAVILGRVEIRSEASRLGLEMPGDYQVSLWVRAIRSVDGSLLGLRETSFSLKQNISRFMLQQMIRQNLSNQLSTLGEDIRGNMN